MFSRGISIVIVDIFTAVGRGCEWSVSWVIFQLISATIPFVFCVRLCCLTGYSMFWWLDCTMSNLRVLRHCLKFVEVPLSLLRYYRLIFIQLTVADQDNGYKLYTDNNTPYNTLRNDSISLNVSKHVITCKEKCKVPWPIKFSCPSATGRSLYHIHRMIHRITDSATTDEVWWWKYCNTALAKTKT